MMPMAVAPSPYAKPAAAHTEQTTVVYLSGAARDPMPPPYSSGSAGSWPL
jgi:hypothetical protein